MNHPNKTKPPEKKTQHENHQIHRLTHVNRSRCWHGTASLGSHCLIELAKLAPSSFNMQNYRFVLVRDPELREQIRAVAWDQSQVTDASLLAIGKQAKPVWPRGERLPDSEVVIQDRFAA